jgi:potassium/hydrogen antiporter
MLGIDFVNGLIFVGSALVLIGIFSSLVANRFGAPLLLVFLVVGMLAGQDGPGGIAFDNYQVTYLVGSIALSVILFDGGLRTRLSTFRSVLAPSMLLATIGVLITATVTGAAAWALLDLTPVEALLLGSIVGSTDAAAVFFLLRTGGLRLHSRVGSTLEIESGTNDPIAVFLVILLTELILAGVTVPNLELGLRLAEQALIGGIAGVAAGFALVAMLNRVGMPGGLHPLFVVAGAVLTYAATSLLGGSGLLAVYLAGLVMANRPTRAYPSIVGFHDAMTWLCQIVMFLVLGLLVTPSTLLDYALPGLIIAVVLMLVARPLAVWLCLAPFGFSTNEKHFISWVGLRGAVSIFLAAIPTLARVPNSEIFFNVAFFVVLVSLLVQGATLTTAARRLGVALRQTTPKTSRVEIDIPGQTEQEIVGYPVTADSVILGLSRLPGWARLLMVVRKNQILGPADAGHLQAGDYGYFLVPATGCRGSTACSAKAPTWRGGSASCSASCRSAATRGCGTSSPSTTCASPMPRVTRRSPTGRMPVSGTGWRSTPRSRSRAPGWWCGASNPAASPRSACSCPNCSRSIPTNSCSTASRTRTSPASSAGSRGSCAGGAAPEPLVSARGRP